MEEGQPRHSQAEVGLLRVPVLDFHLLSRLRFVGGVAAVRTGALPAADILLHGGDSLIVLYVSGDGYHRVFGPVLPAQVAQHGFPGDAGHGLLAAGYVAPQRMPGPEQLVYQGVDLLGGGVLAHVYLFDDYAALLLYVGGVEPGVEHHIGEDIQRQLEVRLGHLAPVEGQLPVGAAVEDAAGALYRRRYVPGGSTLLGAPEEEVLDEVGNPGFRLGFVAGAGADEDADGHRASVRHMAGYDAQLAF